MPYDHLSDFVTELQDDGELLRISSPVESRYEIAEITRQVCQQTASAPALLFDNVDQQPIPIVTNLLGSKSRLCRALGVADFDEVAQRITGLLQPEVPENWVDSLKLIPRYSQLTQIAPRTVKSGSCQQVVQMGRDVDLSVLPVPQHWPGEARPTLTGVQVVTQHAQTKARHVGIHTVEVSGPQTLIIHCNEHDTAHAHCESYRRRGQQMPISLVLGGDPLMSYAAAAPLLPDIDATLLAGFLRQQPLEVVPCRSNELTVPTTADIVIEGLIDVQQQPAETGTVALPTGFYSLPQTAIEIQVTAVTHRANPMLPVTVSGPPPMESHYVEMAHERIFLPLVRLHVPEVQDIHFPTAGCFRNLLFVGIRKQYPAQAAKVMNALWGLAPLMNTKVIVVVDEEVDVHREDEVWFHVGANMHPGRDVIFVDGPLSMHDHASPQRGTGRKMGLDATRKLPAEHPRPWPAEVQADAQTQQQVRRRWSEYGLDGIS